MGIKIFDWAEKVFECACQNYRIKFSIYVSLVVTISFALIYFLSCLKQMFLLVEWAICINCKKSKSEAIIRWNKEKIIVICILDIIVKQRKINAFIIVAMML